MMVVASLRLSGFIALLPFGWRAQRALVLRTAIVVTSRVFPPSLTTTQSAAR
jgi:hypothetical protein